MTYLTDIAADVARRPTGSAAGDNEQRWKAAVRSAFAGKAVAPSSRIALEVEYRLDSFLIGPFAGSLVLDVADRQPQQLDDRVVIGEMAAVLDDLAQARSQTATAAGYRLPMLESANTAMASHAACSFAAV